MREIPTEPAEVGVDERRPRMLFEKAVLLGDDGRPRRVFAGRAGALGTLLELEPPLVGLVVRLEELARLRGVDEYGDAQLARLAPHGIEARIVDGNAFSRPILQVESQVLEDLEAARPGLDVALQLGGGVRAPLWIVDARELEIGEEGE